MADLLSRVAIFSQGTFDSRFKMGKGKNKEDVSDGGDDFDKESGLYFLLFFHRFLHQAYNFNQG